MCGTRLKRSFQRVKKLCHLKGLCAEVSQEKGQKVRAISHLSQKDQETMLVSSKWCSTWIHLSLTVTLHSRHQRLFSRAALVCQLGRGAALRPAGPTLLHLQPPSAPWESKQLTGCIDRWGAGWELWLSLNLYRLIYSTVSFLIGRNQKWVIKLFRLRDS